MPSRAGCPRWPWQAPGGVQEALGLRRGQEPRPRREKSRLGRHGPGGRRGVGGGTGLGERVASGPGRLALSWTQSRSPKSRHRVAPNPIPPGGSRLSQCSWVLGTCSPVPASRSPSQPPLGPPPALGPRPPPGALPPPAVPPQPHPAARVWRALARQRKSSVARVPVLLVSGVCREPGEGYPEARLCAGDLAKVSPGQG